MLNSEMKIAKQIDPPQGGFEPQTQNNFAYSRGMRMVFSDVNFWFN